MKRRNLIIWKVKHKVEIKSKGEMHVSNHNEVENTGIMDDYKYGRI